jgi:hypothetical protein
MRELVTVFDMPQAEPRLRVVSLDGCDSSQAPSVRRLGNCNDEIQSLADELWLWRHIRFLNQGFKADERRLRTGRMNSREAA